MGEQNSSSKRHLKTWISTSNLNETSRKWFHEMGFEVLRFLLTAMSVLMLLNLGKIFLRKMVKIGFLHFTNAPTEQARQALPEDVDPAIQERRGKNVVFFHDETTSQPNEDQTSQWGVKGTKVMKPKSRDGIGLH